MDVFVSILLSDVQVNRGSSKLTKLTFKTHAQHVIEIDLVAKKISQSAPMEFIQDQSKLLLKVPSSFCNVEADFPKGSNLYLIESIEADNKVMKHPIEANMTQYNIQLSSKLNGKFTLQLMEGSQTLSKLSVFLFNDVPNTTPSQKTEIIDPANIADHSGNPFPISLEDGPVFRETLNDYETKITKLKQAIRSTNDLLTSYESLSNQLYSSRASLIKSFSVIESTFPNFYYCEFDKSIVYSFENLTDENKSAIRQLKSRLSSTDKLSGLESSLASKKRVFEDESKKYYDWLSRLLSSGKSKDDKLLQKRKGFELAKIDYFVFLFDTLVNLILDFCNHQNSFINAYNSSKSQRQKIRAAVERASSMAELNAELSKIHGIAGPNKSGILFTQGGQGKSGWHKQWVVLNNGKLSEFMDWRKGTSRRNEPIDISLSSIKPLDMEKRKNCFRVITSTGIEHYFQATSEEDRDSWIQALYDAGQQINFHRSRGDLTGDPLFMNVKKTRETQSLGNDTKIESLQTDGRQRRVSSVSLENLRMVQKVDSSNTRCSECGSTESVEWISMNLLVIFCVKCSSCHRSLGTSISKVRSLKLDVFTQEGYKLLQFINNRLSNAIYEELLPKEFHISPDSNDKQRLKFITNKYAAKQYVNRKDAAKASDLLIHGVRTHNIPEISKSFALGVDRDLKLYKPTDQLTNLDPPSFSVLEYALNYPSLEGKDKSIKVFDLAEYLILNGTKCGDKVQNVIGLSDEALNYWQSKIDRFKGSSAKTTNTELLSQTAAAPKFTPKEHKFNLLKKKMKN
ncbi:hypothetical protein KL942_001874 [Ogataea angusta]|uniref:ADP-ribosylation factor GTPase-activating protein n=1 Tax=Pichia angusta TaxID=870730 RepID=A0ABQ7RY05_PICAN|nr:hypothetical protein KL942_001874 [Ogataea angusta]KAG7849963.1 hypothetical protein KL940_002331 [Ogataea angusta]